MRWPICSAIAALVTAIAMTASATAGTKGNFYGVCGTLSAKGTTYHVRTVNVPCKAARSIIGKIAVMPKPSPNRPYPGRYSGMYCAYLVHGKWSLFCTSASPFRQVVALPG